MMYGIHTSSFNFYLTDINECLLKTHNCTHDCHNTCNQNCTNLHCLERHYHCSYNSIHF